VRTAIITGVSGQDGSYLAEILITKGYRIVGTTRERQRAGSSLPKNLAGQIELVDWDLKDPDRIAHLISQYRPDEVYNFAAYSSGAGMYDDPVGIGDINGLAVTRILEAIHRISPTTRFCQASSSEMFGYVAQSPQTEDTPFCPRSPYGAAKLYAHSMINIYRRHHGLFCCSAILFNHESPRRNLDFVTRKITHAAASIKLGLESELRLGNMEARRDWGFAGDHARAMWLMLTAAHPTDYVIATGETHSVRELCDTAFRHLDLDYRDFVSEDAGAFRPAEPVPLIGNSDKAKRDLGWSHEVGFEQLIAMMVDADLRLLKQEH